MYIFVFKCKQSTQKLADDATDDDDGCCGGDDLQCSYLHILAHLNTIVHNIHGGQIKTPNLTNY